MHALRDQHACVRDGKAGLPAEARPDALLADQHKRLQRRQTGGRTLYSTTGRTPGAQATGGGTNTTREETRGATRFTNQEGATSCWSDSQVRVTASAPSTQTTMRSRCQRTLGCTSCGCARRRRNWPAVPERSVSAAVMAQSATHSERRTQRLSGSWTGLRPLAPLAKHRPQEAAKRGSRRTELPRRGL